MTNAAQQTVAASGDAFAAQCIQTLVGLIAATPPSQLSTDPVVAARLSLAARELQSDAHVRAPHLFFQVLEAEPDSAAAYAIWGLAATQSGDFVRGLMAFDAALMLDPDCLAALGGKILLMALQGPRAGAPAEAVALRRALRGKDQTFAAVFQRLLGVFEAPDAAEIRYLNIGGGPNFQFAHWRNLEAVESAANPSPFHFDPDCVFPLDDASLPLVYSSHCIEHLDDPTVDRVLKEARRVVRPEGALLLKIPDFDRIADDWRRGEPEIICAPLWGLESLQPLWRKRGVEDSVDSRAAMIFCGFWNDAYAGADGHFAGEGSGRGRGVSRPAAARRGAAFGHIWGKHAARHRRAAASALRRYRTELQFQSPERLEPSGAGRPAVRPRIQRPVLRRGGHHAALPLGPGDRGDGHDQHLLLRGAAMTSQLQNQGRQVWDDYGGFLDQALSHGQQRRFDVWNDAYRNFAETGIARGALPEAMASALIAAMVRCPEQPMRFGLAHPQFDETDLPQAVFDALNTGTAFYRFSAEALWRLADIFDFLRDDLAALFGAPWRVLGVRGWSLNAHSAPAGPNEWHLDGLPLALCKIMIFPTPLSLADGTFQVRLADGRELTLEENGPSWVLFRPSELSHRGIPPQSKDVQRYSVEATVVPSVAFGINPFFAGNNARHPYFPWYRACYDGG